MKSTLTDKIVDRVPAIEVLKGENSMNSRLEEIFNEKDIYSYRLTLGSDTLIVPNPITLKWKIPATNIKGVWKPTADLSKRIEADWELQNHESRISIDAPVISLFGHNDENVLCFSCSNAVNRIEMAAKYREEDNHFHCRVILFTECKYPIKSFSLDIRLDSRSVHFSKALRDTSLWWEGFSNLKPMHVPAIAKKPLYSTWYQFHQDLEEDLLLKECALAKKMGFESIIIDDGWQTKDNNRGYDFTGDWKAERFEDFAALVKKIQDIGLKVGIWYSVPFCGVKSEAYKKFKGKFLTEEHRWAPVFDPRYPEVRKYLVDIYVNAIKDWNLDGFKLDFIDDFKSYPQTDFNPEGKDTLSINDAVAMLLDEVSSELQKVKKDVFIEFRQKYTGPAIRKYGNMLRAFDCPGDYVMNRVRIADIKMLAGDTAVHADMVKWHFEENVETAALHYLNTFFGVPQISVLLTKAPEKHLKMIAFYTQYWNENAEVLLSNDFHPRSPMQNYPIQYARTNSKMIVGLFAENTVLLDPEMIEIDIINAKLGKDVILMAKKDIDFNVTIYNCTGKAKESAILTLKKGCNLLRVPPCGLLELQR